MNIIPPKTFQYSTTVSQKNDYKELRKRLQSLGREDDIGYIRHRIFRGWSIEEAINTPKLSLEERTSKAGRAGRKQFTYQGRSQALREWAEEYNINYATLNSRIRYKWSLEKALTTPVRKRTKPNRQV